MGSKSELNSKLKRGVGFTVAAIVLLLILIRFFRKNDVNEFTDKNKALASAFADLRYTGAFRVNSDFIKRIDSMLSNALVQKNRNAEIALLQIKTEYYLLNDNDSIVQMCLSSLKELKVENENATKWLTAFSLSNRGAYRAAIDILDKLNATKFLTQSLALRSRWLLASIYEELKDNDGAVEHYMIATAIGPCKYNEDYYVESIFHLGNMLFLDDAVEEARAQYALALEKAIDYQVTRLIPFGHYHIGKVSLHEGDKETARTAFKMALDFIYQDLRDSSHYFIPFLQGKIQSVE